MTGKATETGSRPASSGAIAHNFADLGALRLHYAETGAGEAPLVLLLHGFPEFWYCWKAILPKLGDAFHAVAPDMRGYNLSDKPADRKAYHIRALVQDVLDLADHFKAEKFYLVAHDWGAAIAYAVAIAKPERINGLVILNGAHPYIFAELLNRNPAQIESSRYIAEFQEAGIEGRLLENGCEWLMNWTFRDLHARGLMRDEDLDAYRAAWERPGAMTAMLNYYRATPLRPATRETFGKGTGLDPAAFGVDVPTLVLWGEADRALITENLDGLEKFIPDLQIIRLPDVGHWVTHEAPERAFREISDFLVRQMRKNAHAKA